MGIRGKEDSQMPLTAMRPIGQRLLKACIQARADEQVFIDVNEERDRLLAGEIDELTCEDTMTKNLGQSQEEVLRAIEAWLSPDRPTGSFE